MSLADCDMENWVRDAADAWENNGVVEETLCYVELLDTMDLETAQEYGRQYDEELQRRGHPVAAYKIGIHLPSVQPRFGLSGPLFGILHGEGALFENNGEVPVEGQALNLEPDFLERRGQSLQPGDLISVGALQGNPRSASDASGTGNRDPEWSNLHADSPAKHVSYYIGDRILTVTANFR